MKTIKCFCGADIWLDDWNLQKVVEFTNNRWNCSGKTVVRVFIGKTKSGASVQVSLASLIIEVEPGKEIDHIDRNIHNNLESNLRQATQRQNTWNKSKRKDSASNFKNVSFRKDLCKYQVYVGDESGKRRCIGFYETAEKAAEYADMAMLRFHGEFAVLNFPLRKEEYICRMELKRRIFTEYLI